MTDYSRLMTRDEHVRLLENKIEELECFLKHLRVKGARQDVMFLLLLIKDWWSDKKLPTHEDTEKVFRLMQIYGVK